ncbi:MAG: hypothetical protein IJB79_07945 [Candidatus Gastranaerophilales bacterium]|nr:hypothetical protein [Candidatus Gastranaerophilales bacterium]
MGNIEKMASAAQKAIGNMLPTTSKVQEEAQQITQDVLTKGSKLEKVLADYETAQGKAIVGLQTSGEDAKIAAVKQKEAKKIVDDGLARARSAVKKAPLSSKAKKEALSNINAEIENRHLSANFANKSAEESQEVIMALSPVDEEARKSELLAKHEKKFIQKKKNDAQALMLARQEQALNNAKRALRQQYLNDVREFTNIIIEIDKKANRGDVARYIKIEEYENLWQELNLFRNKSKNFGDFAHGLSKSIVKLYTDEGLLFAKEAVKNIPPEEVSPRIASEFLSIINGEIEYRIFSGNKSTRSSEEIKEAFEEFAKKHQITIYPLDEEIAAVKTGLWEKHGEKFMNRPGRKSAKVIEELSIGDLGAKKNELQDRYDLDVIHYLMNWHNISRAEAIKLAESEIQKIMNDYGFDYDVSKKIMHDHAKEPFAPMYWIVRKYSNMQ